MELFFLFLLVLTMASALAIGFPVAFALPGSAILTIGMASLAGFVFAGDITVFFAQDGPIQWLTAGVTNFRGVYWEIERDTLIAVPLFVFMGIMLQRSKIAEDLLVTMAQLFGPVPGGLGISVVVVGALLAATTGIVGATVVAMGLISLPAMLRNNYSQSLATGTISASGTLGQIIPPSIVLIILADQLSSATDQASTTRKADYKEATGEFSMPSQFDITSTSAGDMFLGAFLPGMVLVGMYVLYILVIAILRPKSAPAVHFEGKYDFRFAGRVVLALVPPLALILAVLGSIILGVATVNQAGAIGAVGAMIMAGYRLYHGERHTYTPAILAIASLVAIFVLLSFFDLNIKNIQDRTDTIGILLAAVAVIGLLSAIVWSGWRTVVIDDTLKGVMVETAKTTSMVFIILLGAAMLTAAFRSFGGEELVKHFLTGLPGGFWTQFIVVMAVIFVLGFFLDFIEIAVVVVPMVAPILLADPAANITAVWLGVMIGVNMQTSFLTPPFGFALFYLRGVAPASVKTTQIYRGVIVFIGLQLGALAIVGFFPSLVNFLPNRQFLAAETASPPKNPRLQLCLEEHVFARYDDDGDDIRAGIAAIRGADIGYLPDKLGKDLAKSFDAADKTFDLVADVRTAAAAREAATPDYRPLHLEVRALEQEIRAVEAELAVQEDRLKRFRGADADQEARAAVERAIADAQATIADLQSRIPAVWADTRKQFVALTAAETKARTAYRRNVDSAYEPVQELTGVLRANAAFQALGPRLETLAADVRTKAPADMVADFKVAEATIREAPDASAVRSPVTKARRALEKEPKPEEAVAQIDKALEVHAAETAWRDLAAADLLPQLEAYDKVVKSTIGLRLQDRLSSDQVGEVASCLSIHRDISLNF